MKKYYRNTWCVLIFVLLAGTLSLNAQSTFNNNLEVGLGAGYTTYYGDLSNYRINNFGNLFKVFNYNKYYTRQPSLSVLLHKKLTPTLGLMVQGNMLQFGMSDRYRKNNGSLDTAALHYSRSLNFRTSLQDIGLAFTFNLNNGTIFPANAFFYPSFYIGTGVSRFTVKGDLYDENGNPYNYLLPSRINDNHFESNLRDFRTETANRFRNVEPYVDLGIGLNFRVNDVLTISLQSDIKYSASDYLDDVSSKYKAVYATPEEQYAARPGYNVVNAVTLQRGDDNSRNDFYVNNRVVLRINLLKEQKEKPFSPPVIYSANIPYYRRKASDSVSGAARLVSMQRAQSDSLKAITMDSLRSIDSANKIASMRSSDSAIQTQLQNINTELQTIKALLADRGLSPRQVQLQYQADSIKLLRHAILTKPMMAREDSLHLRVFDLQIDSLRYEWEKLQSATQRSGNVIGTVPANLPDAFNKNVEPRFNEGERLNTYQPPTSTNRVNQQRIDSLQRILYELERRSVSDPSSFNTDVSQRFQDSIAYVQQLEKYQQRKQQQRADSIYSYQKQWQRYNDSVLYYSRQGNDVNEVRQDSLQIQRKWYQRLTGRGKKMKPAPNETAMEEDAKRRQYYEAEAAVVNRRIEKMKRDSASALAASALNNVSYEQQATELNSMLQMNADSIQRLQGQIRRSNDSALYYSTLAQKEQDAANALQQEQKWYNSIFTSRKKVKERNEKENNIRIRSQEQQRLYDEEVNRIRARMSEMEARNRELSRDYQSLNSSRENINRYNNRQLAPAVVYEGYNRTNPAGENNYNEIAALRDELSRLRNQVNESPRTDTVVYKAPGINTGVGDSLYLEQHTGDTSQLSSLRREIEQLRAEMAIMQNNKPTVVAEKSNEPPAKFDASLFPVISVYFKTGAVVVADDQLDRMMPFVQVALKNPEIPIVLKGFTDPVGNPASNSVLARKRTAQVRSLLITRFNIAPNRITIDVPAVQAGSRIRKANPLDRRVDLIFD